MSLHAGLARLRAVQPHSGDMTDAEDKKGYDPANQSPAEGQSQRIPPEDRGQNLNADPADKDEPAEGGRAEVSDIPGADTASSGRD